MSTSAIIQLIITIILAIYVLADAVVRIIKKIKGEDEVEWKAKLSFAADLLEKGIEIPKDIMIKLLRNKLSASEYAKWTQTIEFPKTLKNKVKKLKGDK